MEGEEEKFRNACLDVGVGRRRGLLNGELESTVVGEVTECFVLDRALHCLWGIMTKLLHLASDPQKV